MQPFSQQELQAIFTDIRSQIFEAYNTTAGAKGKDTPQYEEFKQKL